MSALPPPLALLPDIGSGEMVVVMFLILLLFGGDKLPQLAKGLGKALREFKKAASDVEQEFKRALDEVPDTPPAKPSTFAKPTVDGPPPAPTPVNRVTPPPTPPAP